MLANERIYQWLEPLDEDGMEQLRFRVSNASGELSIGLGISLEEAGQEGTSFEYAYKRLNAAEKEFQTTR